MNLKSPIIEINGIGEKTATLLRQSGFLSVKDIIEFYPKRYENLSSGVPIKNIIPGQVIIAAKAKNISIRQIKKGLSLVSAVLEDATGQINAVWFNQPYRVNQLKKNEEFYFSGNFEFKYGKYQLTNPRVELKSSTEIKNTSSSLLPIYSAKSGIKTEKIRTIFKNLYNFIDTLPETLPNNIITKYKLISRADAIKYIHFPEEQDHIKAAKRRLSFEELFEMILASRLNKQEASRLQGEKINVDIENIKYIVNSLPFQLTDSQRVAIWQILQDINSHSPMNRLLQGDVGSGKTVVAAIVASALCKNNFQVALMAPTEVLAIQHEKTFNDFLKHQGYKTALLTGKLSKKEKETIRDSIRKGEIDIIIGTHALFQDDVEFKKLGLVIVDEQHRFGVKQRQRLLAKSRIMPHLLAMTATPIPRSLALTLYGELSMSILKDKPKGRKYIKTYIFTNNQREALYRNIYTELKKGRQMYIICGLIESNENSDRKSVEDELLKIKNSILGEFKVGSLHGKMKGQKKNDVLDKFKNGEINILVSTTVIEVGIDIPNATVMLIEDADHFGLSQLHQLRGRVGRGYHESHCFLATSDSTPPSRRLKEIEKSNDGFYLSEVDLEIRGPGEIYGHMQHGELNLKIANLADTKLISEVQNAVNDFIKNKENLLKYNQLYNHVKKYQRLTILN